MKKEKKAGVLIYSIILTSISLILAIVVMNNHISLIINTETIDLETKLYRNIKSNVSISSNKTIEVNSDGNMFEDLLSGSGANISCRSQGDGTYLVEGDEGTKVGSDLKDDNCNDDNYLGTNSGDALFEDNDNTARKNINGFIPSYTTKNIFWNNSKIEDYIENNTNNNDVFNVKVGDTTDGKLFISINNTSILKLIEYDKQRYDDFNEIREINSFTGSLSGNGYIREISNILSLDSQINNGFNFDFSLNGYLLFLTNTGSDIIEYNLNGTNSSGIGIYINPINDSNSNDKGFKILGYDVIINNNGNLIGKMIEMVGQK